MTRELPGQDAAGWLPVDGLRVVEKLWDFLMLGMLGFCPNIIIIHHHHHDYHHYYHHDPLDVWVVS